MALTGGSRSNEDNTFGIEGQNNGLMKIEEATQSNNTFKKGSRED